MIDFSFIKLIKMKEKVDTTMSEWMKDKQGHGGTYLLKRLSGICPAGYPEYAYSKPFTKPFSTKGSCSTISSDTRAGYSWLMFSWPFQYSSFSMIYIPLSFSVFLHVSLNIESVYIYIILILSLSLFISLTQYIFSLFSTVSSFTFFLPFVLVFF